MSSLASKPAAASVPLPDFAGLGFNAEFQLLLACCALQKNLDAALGLQIDRSLDWELVVRLAEHHNVMPMVYQALRDVPDRVPAKVLADLRARFEQNARKNLRLTAELIRILESLESHGIAAMPFKGPVLAELLYGNLALREFSDLDVLVPAHDFLRAKEAVSALGYAPGWSLTKAEERAYRVSGYECAFNGPAGRNLLELQWRILPVFYAVDLELEGLFERAVETHLGDKRVRTLSAEDLLLALSVHAAKHAWIRLCWLRDIAGVAQSSALDWKQLWRRARELGIERILRMSLLLAHRLLAADIPPFEGSRDSEIELLCERIARELPNPEEYNPESLSYFRLMLRLRERPSDRVRFVMRLLLTPGPGEWEVLRLPAFLFPLYRVIRLFRVAGRLMHLSRAKLRANGAASE